MAESTKNEFIKTTPPSIEFSPITYSGVSSISMKKRSVEDYLKEIKRLLTGLYTDNPQAKRVVIFSDSPGVMSIEVSYDETLR